MAWPTDDLVTSNVDSSADSAAAARANIYTLFLRVKELIAGRNTANGVAPLDASSKVPVANIPTLSYLPSTGGTVSGATTFSAGITSNAAVGITSGGLGIAGGITVSTGNVVVSNGSISAYGGIASTSTGNITTQSGYVNANKTSQTSYSTAGLQSTSTSGNAGIGLHCSGATAAYIEHVRGGAGITVKDAAGNQAPIYALNVVSIGSIYWGNASNAYAGANSDASYSDIYFDNTDYLRWTRAANVLELNTGGANRIAMSASGIYPSTDNTLGCGVASNRWSVVYATNGTIQTSDKRRKDHFGDIEGTGAIIDALRPVRFRWKQTGLPDVGFYAQDVAPLIPEATVPGTEIVDWGILPDRLIPFLVAEIQSLRRRVAALEQKA